MTDKEILKAINQYQMSHNGQGMPIGELFQKIGMCPSWLMDCYMTRLSKYANDGFITWHTDKGLFTLTFKGLQLTWL